MNKDIENRAIITVILPDLDHSNTTEYVYEHHKVKVETYTKEDDYWVRSGSEEINGLNKYIRKSAGIIIETYTPEEYPEMFI